MSQDLKIDLAALQERLRAAQALKEELETSQENYGIIRKEIEEIDNRNRELTEALGKLRAVSERVRIGRGKKKGIHSSKYSWNILGVYLEYTWSILGIYSEYTRNIPERF